MNEQLLEHGLIGGLDLGRFAGEAETHMLVCVTELRTKKEIDQFVSALEEIK